MVGWHHQLDGHEFEQPPGVNDRETWHASVHGVAKSLTWLSDWTDWNDWNLSLRKILAVYTIKLKKQHTLCWTSMFPFCSRVLFLFYSCYYCCTVVPVGLSFYFKASNNIWKMFEAYSHPLSFILITCTSCFQVGTNKVDMNAWKTGLLGHKKKIYIYISSWAESVSNQKRILSQVSSRKQDPKFLKYISVLGWRMNNNSSRGHYIWVNFTLIIFPCILALGKLVRMLTSMLYHDLVGTEDVLPLGKSVFGSKEERSMQLTWEKRGF